MNIIFLYIIFLLFMIILFLKTKNYKKELWFSLEKKQHPFRFCYGTALFFSDFFLSVLKKLFPNHSFSNPKLKNKLDKLYVGKDIEKQLCLFQAKKFSYSLLIFSIIIFLGFLYSCSVQLQKHTSISTLNRSNEDQTYSMEVTLENKETQLVDVLVESQKYDFEASFNLFETYREEIVSAMLDKNTGIESIQYPLNFISEIGEKGLTITWDVENENLIDYSGKIYTENIESEGAATTVTAHLSLGEYEASLTIPLVLVP